MAKGEVVRIRNLVAVIKNIEAYIKECLFCVGTYSPTLPTLKQELQFDPHKFHLKLVYCIC